MEKVGYYSFFFLFLVALSLAASILRYSSTSSTRVSSFFPDALGVLFFLFMYKVQKGLLQLNLG